MNRLQGKDLINIGIFTAIYFIVIFAAALAVSFKKKIRSNTKSIIAKNGSAFFVHKKEVLLRGKR